MIYSWEKKITKTAHKKMAALLPKGYRLIGVAVESTETGEAALIIRNHTHECSDVTHCDVWHDIFGDAKRHYSDAVNQLRSNLEADIGEKISDEKFATFLTQFALSMPQKKRDK